MQNILNKKDRELISARMNRVQEHDRPLWGRMTVNEMICHVTDIFRMAFGEITVPDQSTFFTRHLLLRLVLLGLPSPKGKVKTSPALDQAQGHGTSAISFAHDRAIFHKKMTEFVDKEDMFLFQAHGIFGQLTKQEWGRLLFLHTDYHLKQFGR